MNVPVRKYYEINPATLELEEIYRQGWRGDKLKADDEGYLIRYTAPNRHERRARMSKMSSKGHRGHFRLSPRDWRAVQEFKRYLRSVGMQEAR